MKILKIIMYPIYLPSKISRIFWLWIGRKIKTYENSEIAKKEAMLISLKAALKENDRERKELQEIKKQLMVQIDILLMDRELGI